MDIRSEKRLGIILRNPDADHERKVDTISQASNEQSNQATQSDEQCTHPSFSFNLAVKSALVYMSLPAISLLHSLSIAVFIIYLSKQAQSASSIPIVRKVAAPVIPWMLIAATNFWMYWNGFAKRINDAEDAPIIIADNPNLLNDSSRVVIGLFAISSMFANAFLGIIATQKAEMRSSPVVLCVAFLGGLLNYMVSMLTVLVFCFRKHVEYCEKQHRSIKPLFLQPLVKPFYDKAKYVELMVDKIYPTVSGLIRAQACDQLISVSFESAGLSYHLKNILRLCFSVMVYSSFAWTVKNFSVAQLRENLDATGRIKKNIEDYFSILKMPYAKPLRFLDDVMSGQGFYNLLRYCLSLEVSVDIILILSAFGVMSLSQQAISIYISGSDPVAIRSGEESLLLNYIVGVDAAIQIAPYLTYAVYAIAIITAIISTRIQKAMMLTEARNSEARLMQVAPTHESSSITQPAATTHPITRVSVSLYADPTRSSDESSQKEREDNWVYQIDNPDIVNSIA